MHQVPISTPPEGTPFPPLIPNKRALYGCSHRRHRHLFSALARVSDVGPPAAVEIGVRDLFRLQWNPPTGPQTDRGQSSLTRAESHSIFFAPSNIHRRADAEADEVLVAAAAFMLSLQAATPNVN